MTSTKRRRRPTAKATIVMMTTTTRATLLSLSFLSDRSHPTAASSVTVDNVCNQRHYDGHGGVGIGGVLAAAEEYNEMPSRDPIFSRSLACSNKRGHRQSAGRGFVATPSIPRGGGISGWKSLLEKDRGKVVKDAEKDATGSSSSDSNDDKDKDNDDDDEPAPILSSPFLDSFQQEVHEIVGGYRSDVRRIFQQLKDDILQSQREETIADQHDYMPPDTTAKAKKSSKRSNKRGKTRNRRNRRKSKLSAKPPGDDSSMGSKSRKEYKQEGEELSVSASPPLDNDFVMGDTDQDGDEVLEMLLSNERERVPAEQDIDELSSPLKKSSIMNGQGDDNLDNGIWGSIQETPTIETTTANLWNTDEPEAEAEKGLESAEEDQVKTNQEPEKEEIKRTSKPGTKRHQKKKRRVPKQSESIARQRKPRQHQHQEDDEYPTPRSSLILRRGGVDPRVWKALVVSFAFGGLFLMLGMAFKILSTVLGLNS